MLNRGLADGVDEHSVAVFAVHPKDQTYPLWVDRRRILAIIRLGSVWKVS